MLVLFGEGVLKDVCAVEVKPMDIGEGKIVGTQINFTLTSGDRLEYIYDQNIPIENSGQPSISCALCTTTEKPISPANP